MKKFIYVLSFAAISLVSCDYHDPNDGKFESDPETGWVGFANEGTTVTSVAPNGTIVSSIPVVLNAPVNSSGLTVSYTIEAVDGDASYVSAGSLYLAKGELSANIELPVTGAASCSVFNVVLTTTSRDNVSVGFENNSVLSQQFFISPLDRDAMVGTYAAVQTSSQGATQYVVTATAGENANELVLSNIFNAGASAKATVILNEDGTFSFTNPADNFLFSDSQAGDIYFYGLEGSSNCSNGGTMDIDFALQAVSDDGTSLYGPYNLMLTKQ